MVREPWSRYYYYILVYLAAIDVRYDRPLIGRAELHAEREHPNSSGPDLDVAVRIP